MAMGSAFGPTDVGHNNKEKGRYRQMAQMVEMEVSRALAELKLIKKRMEKALEEVKFFGVSIGGKPVAGFSSDEEFISKAQSAFDSYRALAARYAAIKSAIAISNATTKITVGGKEMTVAEALERLRNLPNEELFLMKLKNDYNQAVALMERKNAEAQQKLENHLATVFGAKDVKLSEDQYKAVAEPFLKQFSATLVHPEKLKEQIDALEAELETFKSEVHYALNRSNAITMIKVPA